jgi:hypothetical protein
MKKSSSSLFSCSKQTRRRFYTPKHEAVTLARDYLNHKVDHPKLSWAKSSANA